METRVQSLETPQTFSDIQSNYGQYKKIYSSVDGFTFVDLIVTSNLASTK